MSLTVIAIAALHAIPIVVAAFFVRNKAITAAVALVMAYIAVWAGSGSYTVIDLTVVVVTFLFCVVAL